MQQARIIPIPGLHLHRRDRNSAALHQLTHRPRLLLQPRLLPVGGGKENTQPDRGRKKNAKQRNR